jgi:peptidyl-prolyl cis-trans isomerase A (cyclophilin A)
MWRNGVVKRQLATIGVVALVLAGLMIVNRFEPQRLTAERLEQQKVAAEQLAGAERLEQEMAQNQATPAKDAFKVKFECSNGDFVVEVHPEWAPLGAARFKEAVEQGVYDNAKFFRVVPAFVVQFGIPGDPAVAAKWRDNRIKDDPVKQSNTRGTITFATSGANSRTTQVFINYGNNANLDGMGFAPFGRVVEGMEVVEAFNSRYGDQPTSMQGAIQSRGNAYLDEAFPGLDYIKKAAVLPAE